MTEAIAEFQRAKAFVEPILAVGVLVDVEDGYDDRALTFANTLGAEKYEALYAQYEQILRARGTVNDKVEDCTLFDIFYSYANARSRAAYLIGIAVGQRLGPNAFDVTSGAR